jgi:hypothetical protein
MWSRDAGQAVKTSSTHLTQPDLVAVGAAWTGEYAASGGPGVGDQRVIMVWDNEEVRLGGSR